MFIFVIDSVFPMKPLFWKRIQLNQVTNQEKESSTTVWAELEEPAINVNDFAEMFAKVTRKPEGTLVSSKSPSRVKQQVIHLLDNKRSQAVGIFLRSLHVQMDEIRDALYNVNTAILDQESLSSLFEIVSMITLKLCMTFHIMNCNIEGCIKSPSPRPLHDPQCFSFSSIVFPIISYDAIQVDFDVETYHSFIHILFVDHLF